MTIIMIIIIIIIMTTTIIIMIINNIFLKIFKIRNAFYWWRQGLPEFLSNCTWPSQFHLQGSSFITTWICCLFEQFRNSEWHHSCPVTLLRQFALGANVPLYVMATGYDIDIAPSGIVFQCSVYCSIDKCCSDKSA